MAIGEAALPSLNSIQGIRLGSTSAGIKTEGRHDLVVIELQPGTTTAGVFTQNAFCAAPVIVAKSHLAAMESRYLVINTGNANAGTGEQGLSDAKQTCSVLAGLQGVDEQQILPFSTGVIGEPLPIDKIFSALPKAIEQLTETGWTDAALGIMTTDTRPKAASRSFDFGGKKISVTGIAKGAGMIKPNMATMLSYIATDALIEKSQLQDVLNDAVECSFNRITVDGDTSTNDACILMATGASELRIDSSNPSLLSQFKEIVTSVCIDLAQGLIRDGEGVSKFVTVIVSGAKDTEEALKVGYTVAESPLVKTALFACDPNWGRILMAIGRAGVEDFDVSKIKVHLGSVLIAENGGRASSYTEEAGQAVMDKEEIKISIDLSRGDVSETLWTTDLSHDYVKINAEYRT